MGCAEATPVTECAAHMGPKPGDAEHMESFNLKPGRKLGSGYEVVELLGTGWEGEVYRVVELRTGIHRAAKLFFPHWANSQRELIKYARRLTKLAECFIVVHYHHHDVARIRGSKVDFLVADYVPGEQLYRLIQRQRGRRLPPFEALYIAHALAAGVEQIHDLGDYHGDIHSENIMVRRIGAHHQLRLIDLLDMGRPNSTRRQDDALDIVRLLGEMLGGRERYSSFPESMKKLCKGLRADHLRRAYRNAADVRKAIEALEW